MCAHCIVESGPHRRERLTKPAGLAAIRSAATDGFEMVVFSGGESTTYLSDVLEMSGEARRLGLRTRLVSNGFWALSPEAAARMLERLADGCVDELVVSIDFYHLPYVPAARIRDLRHGTSLTERRPWIIYATVVTGTDAADLAAGDETLPSRVVELLCAYGLDPKLAESFTAVQDTLRQLSGKQREKYKQALRNRIIVTWQPLVVGGRATRMLSEAVPAFAIDDAPATPCEMAGRQITVNASGNVYPCCSLWTNFTDHHFGVADSQSEFSGACESIGRDPLVQLIHEAGPATLVRWLRRHGTDLKRDYTDICSMCEQMLTRCTLAALRSEASACAHEWLLSQVPPGTNHDRTHSTGDDDGEREPLPEISTHAHSG
jgi:MoaA/NifB/PqqE/SkfB family radical SAM enzyme